MTATAPQTDDAAYDTDLADALAACPSVTEDSRERKALMEAIWQTVCTRTIRTVVPMGSVKSVTITPEYGGEEVLAVMEWLRLHETEARALTPGRLYRMMRAVATLGMNGSGRAARADQLRGLTDVPAGTPIRWGPVDEERTAS
jgi:hypothetical protein